MYLQTRQGVQNRLLLRGDYNILRQDTCQICPAVATLRYLVETDLVPGSLFIFEDGRFLNRDSFILAVHEVLAASSTDTSKYSSHSFCIMVATTATEQGAQISLIKTMGRWQSQAYLLYIRTPRDTLCSGAKTLLSDQQSKSLATSLALVNTSS